MLEERGVSGCCLPGLWEEKSPVLSPEVVDHRRRQLFVLVGPERGGGWGER